MPVLETFFFSMLVSDGWVVTGPAGDRFFELNKPDEPGAEVHISVYGRRDRGPVSEDETRDLIEKFADVLARDGVGNVDAAVEVLVLPETTEQHRAVARITVGEPSDLRGLGFLVLWPDQFVVCSCLARPSSPVFGEAERMFATIWPPYEQA